MQIMFPFSDDIHFVLNHTQHPGNIGSAARAIKNMGFSNLTLVSPCEFFPERGMAKAMAAGAEDILHQAKVTDSLNEAVKDCVLLFGTSARERGLQWPFLNVRQASELIFHHLKKMQKPVAILFGCESSGLNNEALQKCHYHVQIPANPVYSSLNLASAVQIFTYELHMAYLNSENLATPPLLIPEDDLATLEQLEGFYQHLEQVLYQIQFIHPRQPKKIMQRLRRLYTKAQLDTVEINILRGILKETQRSLGLL